MNAARETTQLGIGQCAALACIFEATARKPGNVHREADFDDVTYVDFLASATAIAPAVEVAAHGTRLGRTVLEAVRVMRSVAATNTYLGTVLLLAPLAAVPREVSLADGIRRVLAELGSDDARDVYEAIRLSSAGGMGEVDEADIHGEPPADLIAAMRLAADRDLVARQYVSNFADVLERVVPWLEAAIAQGLPLEDAITHVHVRLMAAEPDSLIGRKCGPRVARESADRAAQVLAMGEPRSASYEAALGELDFWLRCDGHRRNPGTTADLIAAGLFVALRDGIISPPFRFYGS